MKGSRAWVSFVDTIELPVLARTLKAILKVTADEQTSLAQLTEVVLRDADLTSGIIKLANTPVYNPSGTPITTISRAVVQIGFESVQSIAISSALVDKLTKHCNRHRLFHCLVRSFTAAVHAKYIASHLSAEKREEIFVAALLFDVGEAAFWASTHGQTSKLDALLESPGADLLAGQRECLGTTFKSISKGLIESWHLGELVKESIDTPVSSESRVVSLAVQIAHFNLNTQSREEFDALVSAVAKINGKKPLDIKQDLRENSRKSAQLASRLGIRNAQQYLAEVIPEPVKRCQNSEVILQSLIALSAACNNGEAFSKIADIVVQGIQEGVNLDRAGLFMAKPDEGKFCLTHYCYAKENRQQLPQAMVITEAHPFYDFLSFEALPRAFKTSVPSELVVRQTQQNVDRKAFSAILAPVYKNQALCGFVYADVTTHGDVSDEQANSFQMVIQQLMMTVSALKKKSSAVRPLTDLRVRAG